ncbi:MAG: hypothetical protein JSS66_07525 [Armatimonadetes bacterium]|nr:hypothetical protein [Armatimonadota bacterium]
MNVFISDVRLTPINRGHLNQDPRHQVFKYMLASLASIDRIQGGVVRVEFDEPYRGRFEEVQAFGYQMFGDKVKFIEKRATNALQWQQHLATDMAEVPDDESVVFFCNDDHIFLDSSLDMLYRCVDAMESDPETYKAVVLSHWPEHLKVAKAPFCHDLQEHDDFVTFRWASDDSYQIVTAALLRKWFNSKQTDHPGWLPRSDGAFWGVQEYKVWLPKRELVRHFDGYGPQNMCIGEAPPLEIPAGFFENNIKIDIGGQTRRPGWTLFNPDMPVHSTHDWGADYKWVEEDIPYFWKNRISTIERHETGMYTGRNAALTVFATAKHDTNWTKVNPGEPEPSWYERAHIAPKPWAMVFYAYNTLTERNYELCCESLTADDFHFDTLCLYNSSTEFDDQWILKKLEQYGLLERFDKVIQAPQLATAKTVSADFMCQMQSFGGHEFYMVVKPDFYVAHGAVSAAQALLESRRGRPAMLNFKKFDIRENVSDVDIRALARLKSFDACLRVPDVKMWYQEPVGLEHWALGYFGLDGVMHGYTDATRKLPMIDPEELSRTWGYCSVLESAQNAGAEVFYDDKVYAMHVYHPVPTKTGPETRMTMGYRY